MSGFLSSRRLRAEIELCPSHLELGRTGAGGGRFDLVCVRSDGPGAPGGEDAELVEEVAVDCRGAMSEKYLLEVAVCDGIDCRGAFWLAARCVWHCRADKIPLTCPFFES